MSLPKRLRDKIEFKHAATPELTACWIWTGDDTTTARRDIYAHLREILPGRKTIEPVCPRPACVNPNHMQIRGEAAA